MPGLTINQVHSVCYEMIVRSGAWQKRCFLRAAGGVMRVLACLL